MGKNKNPLYESLWQAWKRAYSHCKGDELQDAVNRFWKENKVNPDFVRTKILDLNVKIRKSERAQPTISKWATRVNGTAMSPNSTESSSPQDSLKPIEAARKDNRESSPEYSGEEQCPETEDRMRPSQSAVQEKINVNTRELARLLLLKNNGLANLSDLAGIKTCMKAQQDLQKRLKRLQQKQKSAKKARINKKQKVMELKQDHPEIAQKIQEAIGTRMESGRPRLEEKQPLLLKTIVDIVSPGASTDERRRSEVLRSCTTLEDLRLELDRRGITISRTGLYLRLLPKNQATIEGKKHVKTVPVRLIRAEKSARKTHADDHFASGSNLFLRNLAELMGQATVFALSQDDKARIVMGLPAANKQAPILMHMEYRVRLPDHDWVIAPGHKLIPSVYAGLDFDKNGKLSYSGPTYIGIRSGKHDSSTASTHARDFQRLLDLDGFGELALDPERAQVKPIVIVFTDGGPDENPRFPKVLAEFAKHFRNFDLDAVFVSTHAPGQSAQNQVERRMAPLSRDLSGLILPHDFYGSHLDGNGKTIDRNLEIQNFAKAGETLAEVWNGNTINGYGVLAEYICPESVLEEQTPWLNEKWMNAHVRQGQYILQISKCSEQGCCSKRRTNLREVISSQFLPPPVKFLSDQQGVKVGGVFTAGSFGDLFKRLTLESLVHTTIGPIPFDFYCPSIQENLLSRTCCAQYFVSKQRLQAHKRTIHTSSIESIEESIESVVQAGYAENEDCDGVNDSDIVIVDSVEAWMSSEFVDCGL